MDIIKISANKKAPEQERALHWVTRGILRNDPFAPGMEGVLFTRKDDGRIRAVATDGKRIHTAVFPESFIEYLNITVGKVARLVTLTPWVAEFGPPLDWPFPNWEKVMPNHTVDVSLPAGVHSAHLYGNLAVALQDAGHKVPRFNEKYLADVVPICPTVASFYRDEPNRPFAFFSHNDPFERVAVVAPLRRVP